MASSVLFVSPWLHDGGIERNLETKAPWFVRHGYRVAVASWHISPRLAGRPNPVVETLRAHGVPIYELGGVMARHELARRAARLAALAVATRSSVIVGHERRANIVAVLAGMLLARIPRVIVELHNAPGDDLDATARQRLGWLYRRASAVLAVSEGLRHEAVRCFDLPASHVTTIPNPFRLDDIERLAQAAPESPVDGPFITACGRFVRDKGFEDLIRAFAVVARRRPLKLVLLGDGPLREALVRTAQAEGVGRRVLFPGFVANPFSYFARASAVVIASHTESFSRVLVEAMACGVPVIASRCPGPEEVLRGGAYGWLYEAGSVSQLAGVLLSVLDDPRASRALARAAQQRAVDFSSAVIVPRLAAFYLGGPGPGAHGDFRGRGGEQVGIGHLRPRNHGAA